MEAVEETEAPGRKDRKESWIKAFYWLVVGLGLVFLFFFLTGYSFVGNLADEAFRPMVGVLGIFLFVVLCHRGSAYAGLPYSIALLPALIGGGMSLLLFIAMWIPPFTLAGFFYWDEVLHEQAIQTVASPDGQRTATVYFRGVGAYDGGNGRTFVRITRRGIPFIENEVFSEGESDADESTSNYVRWKDDRTLEVVGEPDKPALTIKLGWYVF